MSSDKFGDPGTRDRILDAAQQLIAERGAGVKLREIAEQAGVSRQAVYLHFGDRTGLLVALVQRMDESLHLAEALEHIHAASDSEELLDRAMEVHADFSAAISPVALVLEGAQYHDEALGTAWRDRLRYRHQVHRSFVQRIAEDGDLAPEWSIDAAADLFYAVTLPGPWRELTRELGWTREQYVSEMSALLRRALLRRSDAVGTR